MSLNKEYPYKQIHYWKDKLQGIESLAFPTDYPRPAQIDYSGADLSFSLDKELSQKLKDLSQEKGCTVNQRPKLTP